MYDSLGHAAGDQLLEVVARMLAASLRGGVDICSAFGRR